MNRRVFTWLGVLVLLAAPVLAFEVYHLFGSLPKEITLAAGSPGGRYFEVGHSIASALTKKLGIRVHVRETLGSIENLRLVESGVAEFGLFQEGAVEAARFRAEAPEDLPGFESRNAAGGGSTRETKEIAFVANLYRETVLLLVRRELDVSGPHDLLGRRINLGVKGSGDQALCNVLLDYYGLSLDRIEPSYFPYAELERRFVDKEIDACFVTVGSTAPVIDALLGSRLLRLVSLPYTAGLIRRFPYLAALKIPVGFFGPAPGPMPDKEIDALSVRAFLVTERDCNDALVGAVTALLMDKSFQKKAGLTELLQSGAEFARAVPEFPVHPGTLGVFEPGLRPLLNPDFVEATEGMRSFIVSILIAGYLFARWFKARRIRSQEHKLDRYIRSLLEIERDQVELDANLSAEQAKILEDLLDQVTMLRQGALSEFTAHELREDRAAECMVAMSHALSDKINGKLLRYGVDRLIRRFERPASSD